MIRILDLSPVARRFEIVGYLCVFGLTQDRDRNGRGMTFTEPMFVKRHSLLEVLTRS